MPELPEVETIVRDLSRLATGARITDVEVEKADLIAPTSPDEFARSVRGRRIDAVTRRAKNIVVELGDRRLVVNLGMTGRLLVVSPSDPPPTHVGVRFPLDDGRILVYHDIRRFGRLQCLTAKEWEETAERLGLEPLEPEFEPKGVHAMTRTSRVAIKVWLMDQRRVVGVGNIYASEALHRAGISPRRQARRLTRAAVARLVQAVREVLEEGIEFRGTTLLDYRDAEGNPGGFAERLRVYDRAGRPCRNCGSTIRRIVQQGRSTFYCPECQS